MPPTTLTQQDVIAHLRLVCNKAGSVEAWANDNGISATYVHKILQGIQMPGGSITKPLCELIGRLRLDYNDIGEGTPENAIQIAKFLGVPILKEHLSVSDTRS